ncbi:hypothetical protein [Bacillus marinisedimentorum]|uniref:hypothetical protein n=1 Tax=Bacillus marinisedimentorum TaxID=1821260 RepID=UPI001B8087E5|nr:hypothetical protein [Bacillus marinisedimentorum]
MKNSNVMKWVTGFLEALLGIPIIGGTIVLSFLYTPLFIMLILHIITLYLVSKEGLGSGHKTGSILGIVTSCIAWIPFVGMTMHIITAVVLLLSAARQSAESGKQAA